MTGKKIRRMVGIRKGDAAAIYVQYEDGEIERFTFAKEEAS